MIIGVIIGVVFAVANHRLANNRGRRPLLWAGLGFVFGVFAFLTLRFLPIRAGRLAASA